MRTFFLFILSFLFVFSTVQAQSKASVKGQTATVLTDGSMVYKNPDFDAPVMVTLEIGKKIRISKAKQGTFFRVLIKPGVAGWISDVDVQLEDGTIGPSKPGKSSKSKSSKKSDSRLERKKKPFYLARFLGLQATTVAFREKTLGRRPQESLLFYGFKMTGSDVLIEGELPSEINFLMHSGAPGYYKDITGVPMSGMIILMDAQLITPFSMGDGHMVHLGFGPMMKYSKFETSLGGRNMSLQDINLGVAFSAVAGFQVGAVALRAEYKYFWEKQAYSGLGLSLQLPF